MDVEELKDRMWLWLKISPNRKGKDISVRDLLSEAQARGTHTESAFKHSFFDDMVDVIDG